MSLAMMVQLGSLAITLKELSTKTDSPPAKAVQPSAPFPGPRRPPRQQMPGGLHSAGDDLAAASEALAEESVPAGNETKKSGISPPTPPQSGQQTAIGKVTAFVPTEVIGLYVAAVGILTPETADAKWQIFWLCLLVVLPVVFIVNYLLLRKRDHQATLNVWVVVILLIFAGIAFSAWAAALPETPFAELHEKATGIGSLAVIGLAFLLPALAELMGVAPRAPMPQGTTPQQP